MYIFNPLPHPCNEPRASGAGRQGCRKKFSQKILLQKFFEAYVCILLYTICLSTPDAACLALLSCKSDSRFQYNPIKLSFHFFLMFVFSSLSVSLLPCQLNAVRTVRRGQVASGLVPGPTYNVFVSNPDVILIQQIYAGQFSD